MEQKDIDIYEILNGMPDGTTLYTPMCGKVELRYLQDNKEAAEAIITNTNDDVEYTFNKNGKYVEEGEVLLFPSKEMRDWSKFFKKGDVLTTDDGKQECIFDGWYNKNYTQARVKYWLDISNENNIKCLKENQPLTSVMFKQEDKEKIECYINTIEEWYGGKKLNRETLEIEKPKPKKETKKEPAFEIGNLYVFNEEDEDGELTIIGKLIGKNESEDTLSFGDQYEIENEKFVTDQAFDLRISVHEELREATELEVELFNKHCALWEKKQKEAKEQPVFKTFDKVLVRDSDAEEWEPAIFIRMSRRRTKKELPYQVFHLLNGTICEMAHCITFEENGNIAFTDYDIEDLPF